MEAAAPLPSKLSEEPKDQDYYEDEAQNAASPAGAVAAIAVPAAAQENDEQHNNENCNHERSPPDLPSAG